MKNFKKIRFTTVLLLCLFPLISIGGEFHKGEVTLDVPYIDGPCKGSSTINVNTRVLIHCADGPSFYSPKPFTPLVNGQLMQLKIHDDVCLPNGRGTNYIKRLTVGRITTGDTTSSLFLADTRYNLYCNPDGSLKDIVAQ